MRFKRYPKPEPREAAARETAIRGLRRIPFTHSPSTPQDGGQLTLTPRETQEMVFDA